MFLLSLHHFTKLLFTFLHHTPPPVETNTRYGIYDKSFTMLSVWVEIPIAHRKKLLKIPTPPHLTGYYRIWQNYLPMIGVLSVFLTTVNLRPPYKLSAQVPESWLPQITHGPLQLLLLMMGSMIAIHK